ncbi:hypothetical protein [Cellulosimicrobium funkei]|uniref:hypothetical protein n=1 Tax=Cellulosimicrobium funkei TaxID=264251 RepID=UPI0037DCBF85
MEHRRRTFDAGPGAGLLLPASAIETVARLHRWQAFAGLADGELLLSPLSASPLPLPWTVPAGRRRWATVRPEAMWHPLLWLPERLSTPRVLRDPVTGETWGETYDEWALRVVLELTEASPVTLDGQEWVLLHDPAHDRFVRPVGPEDHDLVPLFDARTGTWLDVLSTVGLDVDDPADVARVEAWLAGGADAALDAVDLDRHLRADGRDPAWSLDRVHRPLAGPGESRTYVEDLRDASSALVARELGERAARLGRGRAAARELGRQVGTLARIASTLLSPRELVAEDLGLALSLVTASAERATTRRAALDAVADLRMVLGPVAQAAAVGLDRVALRSEIETAQVHRQVATLSGRTVA